MASSSSGINNPSGSAGSQPEQPHIGKVKLHTEVSGRQWLLHADTGERAWLPAAGAEQGSWNIDFNNQGMAFVWRTAGDSHEAVPVK
eukprot:5785121-Lingulodinium_polyedra.AAC.1